MKSLTPEERQVLQRWLRTRLSLHDVEQFEARGILDNQRITKRCKRIYALLWTWSAHRFFGAEGQWQERVYQKNGSDFIARRIERCKAIIEQLKA